MALQRLCDLLSPGSRPAGVRRLRGGISATMHAVDLLQASGGRLRIVVRRFGPATKPGDAILSARTTRFWRTLQLTEQLGLPAPRPVWLDQDAEIFDTPAVVMTRVPGHGMLMPFATHAGTVWLHELAEALVAIHRAPFADHDASFLPGPGQTAAAGFAKLERDPSVRARHADHAAVYTVLRHWWPRIRPLPACLIHGDYWSGNTLWRYGRLQAVVDWEEARIDCREIDVAYCRLDLYLQAGPAPADQFLHAYEAAIGTRIEQRFFWDLLAAVKPMPDPAVWLPGYHDLGGTQLTAENLRSRLSAFISDALARAAVAE
ncbi:MAG: phosphotransferase family protein [Dehalococcoidia bacterium]